MACRPTGGGLLLADGRGMETAWWRSVRDQEGREKPQQVRQPGQITDPALTTDGWTTQEEFSQTKREMKAA